MLTSGVALLYNNARPHTAARTRALLDLNGELFDTLLSIRATYLFIYLKKWLRSQRFNNNEELMEGVKTWLSSQTADLFGRGIQKHIPRYDKCLDLLTPHRRLLSEYPSYPSQNQYCEHVLSLRLHAFTCSVHYKSSPSYD
jgi:hypothetical protein